MLISSALVLLMTPGLAFFYGGLVKRKNVINTIMSSIFVMGLASVMWMLVGFTLSFSGDIGGVIGNFKWFALNQVDALPGPYAATIPNLCFAIYQMMFAIITPALITGSIVERMKFSSLFVFVAVWSLCVYYPLAHMVWGGGILQQLGLVDFAGGFVVHISSGVSALILALILGKRTNIEKASYHPHNVPFVLLGAALLWFGWFGFNAGSAGAANEIAVRAFMNTNMSAASALLSWMFVETVKNGKPTLVGTSTGFVVGLAAVTPAAGFVPVWASVLIGLVASPLCFYFITHVKPKFGYDDALDTFGCHCIGSTWGVLATGLFAKMSLNGALQWNGLLLGGGMQLMIRQILGVGVTVVLSVAGTLFALWIAKLATKKIRVSVREESMGLDISEHGESAYPAYNGMDN
ncbi:MAG: ammonium transporter [Anaerofustis sp.]